jgi:hypothetical protein
MPKLDAKGFCPQALEIGGPYALQDWSTTSIRAVESWNCERLLSETDGVSGGPIHAGFDSRSIFEGALVQK